MLIAESEEYTFRIDCIVNSSCHQNSNYFCPFKNSNERWSIDLYYSANQLKSDLHLINNEIS